MTGELPRIPAALAQSPATDKVVFQYLQDADEPLTQTDLAEQTRTSQRTIRDALTRMERRGLVESWRVGGDARAKEYRLNPDGF